MRIATGRSGAIRRAADFVPSIANSVLSKPGAGLPSWAVGLVLALLPLAGPGYARAAGPAPSLALGARCGFLGDCTWFDPIGLHVGTDAAVRLDSSRSAMATQGRLRLALSLGNLAEAGVAGQLNSDGAGPGLSVSPVSLFARLRLLPLPLGPLAGGPLRLALTYQHELVAGPFGQNEPLGSSRGTLRLVAGQSWGRVDVDASLGVVLAQPEATRPRPVAFEPGAAVSVWLWGQAARTAALRLTAEALARFSLDPAFPGEQNLLVGFVGTAASGYGGGVALGTQVHDRQAGFVAVARLQVSWGQRYKNPWAERKEAAPETTPEFIWKLLGAIDPVLGQDGCVYTDPTPERPASRWFCIGKPAPEDAAQIVVADGRRIAAGSHLWELGGTLRLDDGRTAAAIPLSARFRKAVWDWVDRNERERAKNRELGHRPLCAGQVSILHGTEPGTGTAAMLALDDFGGGAALLGEQILRQRYCSPEAPLEEQALTTLSALGALRRQGPRRAKPLQTGRLGEAMETEAAARKAGSGVPAGGVAEHVVPPQSAPPALSAKVREHLLTGNLNRYGEAKGWHYEPTGVATKGTKVLEHTRSAVDGQGVYEANVLIEGVKKDSRSSFFPAHWSLEEVDKAIEEAYRNRLPTKKARIYRGSTSSGLILHMEIDTSGQIRTVYPIHQRLK